MTPDQFKRMRKDLGLSQSNFAEILGCTENMISLYERGKSPIPKVIRAFSFGLWFESFAGYVPSFTAMLCSNEDDVAKTIALVDAKKQRGTEFIFQQISDSQ